MASPEAMVSLFASLAPRHRDQMLIGPKNIYAEDPGKIVQRELRTTQSKPTKPKQLAEYLTASGPLHCSDGWSYLGRALGALVTGDRRAALHLAYYAELRAAFSLLSSQGIAALNRRHFVITEKGNIQRLASELGTHRFVWKVLETWGQTDNASTILGNTLTPYGVAISDWLTGDVASWASWKPVAGEWFSRIGLDLRLIAEDRDARNLASYGVGDFSAESEPDIDERLNFVVSLWELLEPDQTARFRYLDQHLLRITLEQAFSATYSAGSDVTHEAYVLDALTNGLKEGWSSATEDFLLRKVGSEDHPVLIAARRGSPLSDASRHIEAMSRAALLLRVAAGSWLKHFRDAGFDPELLAFHWGPYGRSRGLWDRGLELTSCAELWDDIGGSLDTVLDWMKDTPDAGRSAFTATRELAGPLSVLSSMEVVALWSLA